MNFHNKEGERRSEQKLNERWLSAFTLNNIFIVG